tara:strand:+ start:236 stop:1576 length:1341 start_codon:yes stop_codon:yes gene_type:complete
MIKTKNRHIFKKVPAVGTDRLMKKLSKVESRSMHGQMPIAWKKAENFNIYDLSNNKFIDFTSTIFVTNIGHANKRLISYLKKALGYKLLHSYAYIHQVREKYIKKLVKFAGKGFEKAFLMSAGTEATEAALKLMRLNGQKLNKKKLGIICFEGNWHGRTMGAQLMSGNEKQKKWIGFKDKQIFHIPFPYPWKVKDQEAETFLKKSLKKLSNKVDLRTEVCGIMIETFQGWGSVYYPKKYIQLLSKICKKNKILIAFDEMQAGFGRTGFNFGFQYYGVKPDLICCGKGMGGGVPLSGVIGKKKILDLPEVGNMSSTNSANPLVCYAGLAVIDEIIEKKLVLTTKKKGDLLINFLKKIKKQNPNIILSIQGKGLIAAIIFKKNKKYKVEDVLKNVCFNCMKEGLLVVYTGMNSIKIGPPLSITKSALLEGLSVLEKNISVAFSKHDNN